MHFTSNFKPLISQSCTFLDRDRYWMNVANWVFSLGCSIDEIMVLGAVLQNSYIASNEFGTAPRSTSNFPMLFQLLNSLGFQEYVKNFDVYMSA